MHPLALENHDFFKWFLICVMSKYSDFTGRARRKEFWMYTLLFFIFSLTFVILGAITSSIAVSLGMLLALLYVVIFLALICPTLALSVRRLHDVGKSGLFLIWLAVPVVGWLLLMYLCYGESLPGENKYGDPPWS